MWVPVPLPEPQARNAWRLLCANWRVFRGTPVRYWFDSEVAPLAGFYRPFMPERAVVVPGQPDRDPVVSALGHRDRLLDKAFRIHRRHPRLLFDPRRHDMFRRPDAGFLAGLGAEPRLDEDEALDSLVGLVADQPRKVFKL